jgi:hypothetical protein
MAGVWRNEKHPPDIDDFQNASHDRGINFAANVDPDDYY